MRSGDLSYDLGITMKLGYFTQNIEGIVKHEEGMSWVVVQGRRKREERRSFRQVVKRPWQMLGLLSPYFKRPMMLATCLANN
ncbi:hypothetical protein Nepgr_025334 [Nepenthes gracilis]|uniref:Uncharacterized protein n=1 Tax=Nepenthes gracilis TaxID=150966 RepID=A0AAD3Y1D6_NEPGR|nr:hypothetical protein Nepgr_025334 [Nepenthes gracilis]